MTAETNELALFEVTPESAVQLFTDGNAYSEFYAKVKAEVEKLTPDTTTKNGRDEIKAMAFKVTKTKTALDKQALALTEEWRVKTNAVNASRKLMTTELDALAKEVRKPLTDWEDAEKQRIDDCRAVIDWFKSSAIVTIEDTAARVRARGTEVFARLIDPDKFRDLESEATAAKALAVDALKSAMARLTREEAEKAELEALRTANAERERIEAEKAEAARLEAERLEAEGVAEQNRIAAEQAEAARIELAKQEAAEAARKAEQQAAQAAQDERDRLHAEQLAAERARADQAQAERLAEVQRIADEQAERDRKAKEEAEALAKREADQAHRTKVKAKAKEAIMTCGADEETARKIVMAIIAGEVPNVRLDF